jgi:hypothetical protein
MIDDTMCTLFFIRKAEINIESLLYSTDLNKYQSDKQISSFDEDDCLEINTENLN